MYIGDVYFINLMDQRKQLNWEKKAPLPIASFRQAIVVDEKAPGAARDHALVYAIGGALSFDSYGRLIHMDRAFVYNTATDVWSDLSVKVPEQFKKFSGRPCLVPGTRLAIATLNQYLAIFDLDKAEFTGSMRRASDRMLPLLAFSLKLRQENGTTAMATGVLIMYWTHGLKFIPVPADASAIELEEAVFTSKKISLQKSPLGKHLRFFVGFGQMAMYQVNKESVSFWDGDTNKFLPSEIMMSGSQTPLLAGLPWFSNIKCDEN